MKNLFLFLACLPSFVFSQITQLVEPSGGSTIRTWKVISVFDDTVGVAYVFSNDASLWLIQQPETSPVGEMVVPLGFFWDEDRPSPNEIIASTGHFPYFPENRDDSVSPVYLLIKGGEIDWVLVDELSEPRTQWRFLVKKQTEREFQNGATESTEQWMIIDVQKAMSLSNACLVIKGFGSIEPDTKITATGLLLPRTPFLFQGKEVGGPLDFESQPSFLVAR